MKERLFAMMNFYHNRYAAACSVLLAITSAALAQQPAPQRMYDLVLANGRVIDPKNNIDEIRDVAIAAGRIAAVAPSINPAQAKRVVDVSGMLVTPGLVDIHVHVYAGTGVAGSYHGDNSVYPDNHSFRACTTTMVDAGSSGWSNFEDFNQRIIKRAKTRVLAFVNIVGRGMGGGPQEQDTNDMDAKRTAQAILENRSTIIGVKTAHYAGPEWVPVDRAVEAAGIAKVPVMVDFGIFRQERTHQELVLKHLRPGDIYTHAYLDRVPMLDEQGKVRPYLFEARRRGVIFDVGHGGGSFVFKYAVPATQQGFFPDSISTDLHIGSMNSGMKDMVNVMSKFLSLNMPLKDVIRASTWNPARQIQREELGHLTPGATADVSVLRIDRGYFGYLDVDQKMMTGTQRLGCEISIMGGEVQFDLNARTYDRWDRR